MLSALQEKVRQRLSLGRVCLVLGTGGIVATGVAACHGGSHVGHTEHLCGINGTMLNTQEWCPGVSHPHHWEEGVVYRERYGAEDGIEMCMVVNNHENSRRLFSRCHQYATSIWLGPSDFGGVSSRIYCKNNNVAIGRFRCWAYGDTEY
jgi:hypothetical protein